MIRGYFKGVYHVFSNDALKESFDIEEFGLHCFESRFCSDEYDTRSLSEILPELNFQNLILDLVEVPNMKDFYIDIFGEVTVNYVKSFSYWGEEDDAEVNIHNYKIKVIDLETANKFV